MKNRWPLFRPEFHPAELAAAREGRRAALKSEIREALAAARANRVKGYRRSVVFLLNRAAILRAAL